jgi:hypothetical protein
VLTTSPSAFGSGVPMRVWEGHTTRLFAALGLPNPYYSKIFDVLKRAGCVRQLQRGSGRSLSRWELLKPLTQEAFTEHYVSDTGRRNAETGQQILALGERVTMCEQMLGTMQENLQRIATRVGAYEREVIRLTKLVGTVGTVGTERTTGPVPPTDQAGGPATIPAPGPAAGPVTDPAAGPVASFRPGDGQGATGAAGEPGGLR